MTDLESSYTYGVLKRAIAEIDRSGAVSYTHLRAHET